MRISRVTLLTFVLAMMVLLGLYNWKRGHRDDCDAYLAGVPGMPATQMVAAGTRTVEAPCRLWALRQPLSVQTWCLAELVLLGIFAMEGMVDVKEEVARRRRRRGLA
jgi:hypothetical protein